MTLESSGMSHCRVMARLIDKARISSAFRRSRFIRSEIWLDSWNMMAGQAGFLGKGWTSEKLCLIVFDRKYHHPKNASIYKSRLGGD
jgi:hypothetical protein